MTNVRWSTERDGYIYIDHQRALVEPPESIARELEGFDLFCITSNTSGLTPRFAIVNQSSPDVIALLNSLQIPKHRRILVVSEPRCVDPYPFSRHATHNYGVIIFTTHYEAGNAAPGVGWPLGSFEKVTPMKANPLSQRLDRFALIQANKFSAIRGELYSLRRQVLLRGRNLPIDLFGHNWDQSFLKNTREATYQLVRVASHFKTTQHFLVPSFKNSRYLNTKKFQSKGPVADKFDTLSEYRFAIAIENELGFASEKLFESLASGCVTIYVGPSRSDWSDLPGLIQVRPKVGEILELIKNLPADPYLPEPETIKTAALTAFRYFEANEVFGRLGRICGEVFRADS